ncbi:MAG: hypothetical protein ABW061_05735, partial [Polyangiaceae bacterium]
MKLLAKVGSLALIAAVAGGVVVGCSGSEINKPGSAKAETVNTVGLELQPVAGVTLNTIHYIVTKDGVATPVLEGDLPTPGTGKTFTVGLPIPVGNGYTLSLSAVSVESAVITCAGSVGPFDIAPNQTKQLATTLVCTDANKGNANNVVTVATDACPRLIVDYVVVSPNTATTTAPNNTIAVATKAHDLDNKPLTYAWKLADPTIATFASATAATTTLTCVNKKDLVDITLTANNGECIKAITTQVSCTSLTCGNGAHDPGEECDATAGDTQCLPTCKLAVCGNGNVETPVEACDPVPADLDNCTALCQLQPIVCGDGKLTSGEDCDGTKFKAGTPANATCTALCKIEIPETIVCGNNIKQAGELCDPVFTVNNCGSDCKEITSAACFACENTPDTCIDFVDCSQISGNAAVGTPGAGIPKANLCNETLDCIRDSKCAAGGNGLIKCY